MPFFNLVDKNNMSETSKTQEPTKNEIISLAVSISGVSLFTSLLAVGVIGPVEYSYLITLMVFVALAILFRSRIIEIFFGGGFGGIKLTLNKLEKEVKEVKSSVEAMQMSINKLEESALRQPLNERGRAIS